MKSMSGEGGPKKIKKKKERERKRKKEKKIRSCFVLL